MAVWRSYDPLGGTIGTEPDILVARSTDAGATWTAPVALNSNAATDSGADTEPQVTTDGAGNWVAVWSSGDSLGATIGTDGDILVSRSTDAGATWTPPAALNTNAATDAGDDRNPQVTTDGAGNWVAVWYSRNTLNGTIGTDKDILVSRSTDAGATWTPPNALNSNAATDFGADTEPQVTTDGAGNWVAVWVSTDSLGDTIGTEPDILVARSTDAGATWTAPVALNSNAATDAADGFGEDRSPQVTTDGAGNWVAVWHSSATLIGQIGSDWDIMVSRSTDAGATWTAVVPLDTIAGTSDGTDQFAQVTTTGSGNWVAVWASRGLGGGVGGDYDIFVARSSDAGATWTAPVALNTNAVADSGDDQNPQVTTDGAGNWVAVWDSPDSLFGSIGQNSDKDIFYSTNVPVIPAVGPWGLGLLVTLLGVSAAAKVRRRTGA